MKVVLSHGKESSPQSTKIVHLQKIARDAGHEVIVPDCREIPSPDDRAELLLSLLQENPEESWFLAGSSMGGYVSLVAAAKSTASIAGIFLMAPAVYLESYQMQSFPEYQCPISIIHARQDEIVPSENAIRFAKDQNAKLLLVSDDHRLSGSIQEIGRYFGDCIATSS